MRSSLASLLLVLGLAGPASAQGLFGASPYQPPTSDKTGTDPLNLQQQVDVRNVYATLEDFYVDTTSYRHAVPLMARRLRVVGTVPIGFSNLTGLTEGGLSDIGADVEWTPWLTRRGGLLVAFRTTWDTATSDAVGLGTNTLAPTAQFVFRFSPRALVAPFVSYRKSVGGDQYAFEVEDTTAGASIVWRTTERTWVSGRARYVIDSRYDRRYGDLSGEVGWMLLDRVSTYAGPTFGLGSDEDRGQDWGVTFGFRIVP
ncbi:hypothetical protein TBR22_A44160 [Luteitalea sp. TBR-22]|uniref:hypothetical protein n=1 Tax=Luteitalea sp. TBR-22 TaxID=2802971 RepID=UPI001AFB99A3|nr:hypothetical protein [Luteitalea sp. TBR-22]BCS35189.1 hypothetical protein TBR22_A44160 [Luteitalea sp. TBR-22]